jgi:hypothetical protein
MALTTPEFKVEAAGALLAGYGAIFGHAPKVFDTRTGDGARLLEG